MPGVVPVSSPQFRVKLIRKLGNLVPGHKVEFVEGLDNGVGFRLKDRSGRYRSNIVRIYRNQPHTLDTSSLVRSICGAGVPPAGLPRGLSQRWLT
jgi:hypothetical protein